MRQAELEMEIQLASAEQILEVPEVVRIPAVQAVQVVTLEQALQSEVKVPAPEQARHFWVVAST